MTAEVRWRPRTRGRSDINSPVTTGQLYQTLPAPPGGTIKADTGSTVDINSSVTSGVTPVSPNFAVNGQVVAAAGGTVIINSHASVSVPIEIDGTSGNTAGGVVELKSGGGLTGAVQFVGAGGTLALYSIPAANDAPQLEDLDAGTAIELPGSSVISVDRGGNSNRDQHQCRDRNFRQRRFLGRPAGRIRRHAGSNDRPGQGDLRVVSDHFRSFVAVGFRRRHRRRQDCHVHVANLDARDRFGERRAPQPAIERRRNRRLQRAQKFRHPVADVFVHRAGWRQCRRSPSYGLQRVASRRNH